MPPLRISYCVQVDTLYCGEVGYLAAQIKSVQDARVGDTVTMKKQPAASALPGYQDIQPMVYCGLFPTDSDDYQVRIRVKRGDRRVVGVRRGYLAGPSVHLTRTTTRWGGGARGQHEEGVGGD